MGETKKPAPVRPFGNNAVVQRVAILLFDDVDLLDVGGPYEVLLTANRLRLRQGEPPLFDVVTAAPEGERVTAYGGLGLVPHRALEELDGVDIAIVPGAIAINDVLERPQLQDAIRRVLASAQTAVSVCTGAFVLGDAGLLAGRPWTTHWEDVASLAERLGSGGGERVRWVDSGDVVTAGGLSSGIAMTLHLVERVGGRSLAEATANQIDYEWDPEEGLVAGGP